MSFRITLLLVLFLCTCVRAQEKMLPGKNDQATLLRNIAAPNATQAVAVDEHYFYTISNSRIVKRRRADGATAGTWQGPLKHLNSGVVLDGKLYCANTNFPETPMASSLEIFDVATMTHTGTHSFGHYLGSFTWIDRWQGEWYLMFVHYNEKGRERDLGVEYTTMVRMDDQFRQTGGWTLPDSLTQRLAPMSISGGGFLPDGRLLLSPHHFEELYVVSLPKMGYELRWESTIAAPSEGQGLALDPVDPGTVWGIHRPRREVVVSRLPASLVGKPQQQAGNRVDEILDRLHHPRPNQVLAVSHRGDWRYAPENSLAAVQRCIDLGVDVVEIDVRMTKDGHLVALHDETVDRTTNGKGKLSEMTLAEVRELRLKTACGTRGSRQQIPTLEEIMTLAKGRILVNLDKVEDKTLAESFAVLQKTGTVRQAILKGRQPVRVMREKYGPLLDSVVYMPIIWHDLKDPEGFMRDYNQDLKPVAYEMLFATEDAPQLQLASRLQSQGQTFLAIALWDDLVAGHTDEQALLEGADSAWGWLIDHGAGAIMTDRPAELLAYLRGRGLHE